MAERTKVFVPDKEAVWLPAELVEAGPPVSVDATLARCDEDIRQGQKERREVPLDPKLFADASELPLQNEDTGGVGAEDMTTLDYLHEPGVLYNLRRRYFEKLPYTFCGSMVIAINPYEWLEHFYTEENREKYLTAQRDEHPPHVYAVSSAAFRGVSKIDALGRWAGADQSILVSGESGAGKTETVKIMMGHLASVAGGASSDEGSVVRRVLESQPLLESFGNAKTVRNDNSSRFGKFTQLEFAMAGEEAVLTKTAALVGSRCRTYLLEKSRVVNQAEGERTYHCFYGVAKAKGSSCLPPGVDDAVDLEKLESFRYTKFSDLATTKIEGVPDPDRHARTWDSLGLVGVDAADRDGLERLLAATILLGELEFEGGSSDEKCTLSGETSILTTSALSLGVKPDNLQNALTERTMRARNDVYKVPLDATKASDARDALAKEIYVRAFDWVVANINASTSFQPTTNGSTEVVKVVGLLDIFGFESFKVNRFEQLCINYTNEKLQQKFTIDLFKTVQQEYDDERVPWSHIAFPDNAAVLALIDARMGVIDVLNEECVRPRGSDEGFVSKLTTLHAGTKEDPNPRFQASKLNKVMFTIQHYAGPVAYTATSWLERNNDTLPSDLKECAQGSSFTLLSQLFVEAAKASTPQGEGQKKRRGGTIAADTVSTKFKTQLNQLMDEIEKTAVQYVRCVKPNTKKSNTWYDAQMVAEQLRCAGVIEAIRVSRAGYPNKLIHLEFARRFSALDPDAAETSKLASISEDQSPEASCKALSLKLLGEPATDTKDASYAVGVTRIYFKTGVLENLERQRAAALADRAVKIQACCRRFRLHRDYRTLRRGVVALEARARRNARRGAFLKLKVATLIAQSARRGVFAKRIVHQRRRVHRATRIQAFARGAAERAAYVRTRAAAVRVQSRVRTWSAVTAYVVALAEAKEQAKLENQLEAMQRKLAEMEEANRAMQQQQASAPAEVKVVTKIEASAEATQAAQEALERAEAERRRADETSAEMYTLLKQLRAENEKLRKETTSLKDENTALKRKVSELEAGQSMRLDWLTAARQSIAGGAAPASDDVKKKEAASSAVKTTPKRPPARRATDEVTGPDPSQPELETAAAQQGVKKHVSRFSAVMGSLGFGSSSTPSSRDRIGRRDSREGTSTNGAAASKKHTTNAAKQNGAETKEDEEAKAFAPQIALPLNRFWQDVPTMSLAGSLPQHDRDVVLIHLKVGAQYLAATGPALESQAARSPGGSGSASEEQRYLKCEKPARGDAGPKALGYRTPMTFRVELVGDSPSPDLAPVDRLVVSKFRLKSLSTGGYVTVGGLFQRYCLVASAATPAEAATFQFVPRRQKPGDEPVENTADDDVDPTLTPEASMEKLRAKQLLVALRVVDGPKAGHYCRVRPDTYVNVAPPVSALAAKGELSPEDRATPLLSVELLVPLQSYELAFHASQLGLIVSKTMPLRVVRFKDVGGDLAPAAELSGRCAPGDVLVSADGVDLLNCTRKEAVDVITSTRPITIGFRVAHANPDLIANYQSPKRDNIDLLTPTH